MKISAMLKSHFVCYLNKAMLLTWTKATVEEKFKYWKCLQSNVEVIDQSNEYNTSYENSEEEKYPHEERKTFNIGKFG